MQDVIFCEYKEEDAQEVEKFLKKIFTEMGWTPRPEDYIDDVKGGFYGKKGFFILGKLQNTVLATAGIIELSSTTVALKRFYVDSSYRGHGIAQQLLGYVFEILRKKGYKTLFLDVDVENFRAIRFYEKEGFEKCTVEPNPLWWESNNQKQHIFYKMNL